MEVSIEGVGVKTEAGVANVGVGRASIVGVAVRKCGASVASGRVGLAGNAVGLIAGRLQAASNARTIPAAIKVKKQPFIFISASLGKK